MATKTTAPARNTRYVIAKVIVTLFVIGAMVISYTHIVHLFNMLGLTGWQAWVAPAFVDGFALLGLLGRSEQFDATTRRTGLRLQIAATLVSLVANVAAGGSLGGRIFGALVVVGYVVAEWYSDQLKPAATKAETAAATRSAAAQKAAATRKANADAKATTAAVKKATTKARTARKAKALTVEAIGSDAAYV
jgi:hypothetical protein